jgi:hypothetical protein
LAALIVFDNYFQGNFFINNYLSSLLTQNDLQFPRLLFPAVFRAPPLLCLTRHRFIPRKTLPLLEVSARRAVPKQRTACLSPCF